MTALLTGVPAAPALPKRRMTFFEVVNAALSFEATLIRGGAGGYVVPLGPRPKAPLTFYGRENCADARKVREALSMLDLDATVYPCPDDGVRYRADMLAMTRRSVPFLLIDDARGASFSSADKATAYLFQTYGRGSVPWQLALGPLTTLSSMLAGYLRLQVGRERRPSRAPDQPLELFGYEASRHCRVVREVLDILELPHVSRALAPGSPRRRRFARQLGRMQLPYLFDPNTRVGLFDSRQIIRYLNGIYSGPIPARLYAAAPSLR